MTPKKTPIEPTTVTSDRLFSLDSADSSYIHNVDFMNGLKTQEEDIKKASRFSCDDSAETATNEPNLSVNTTHTDPSRMVESTFDFSERLFSLDSDDTSYIQHADYFNGLETQKFTKAETISDLENCSVGTISATEPIPDDLNPLNTIQPNQSFIFENLLEKLDKIGKPKPYTNIDTFIKNMPYGESNSISTDSDNQAELGLEDISMESDFIPWHPNEDTSKEYSDHASNFLSEAEISLLIDGETTLPSNSLRETQDKVNEDTIACLNVRNKYEHTAAAELFLQENLSFLALQEPFCSKHKTSDSWKAYRQLELQSARIRCFETPYQVILFDTWKWGGKLLYPFQSRQHGRVTSIGFKFNAKQKIGIISVYAPANVMTSSTLTEGNSSLQITSDLVSKTIKKWEAENPTIQIIILGDLQETISVHDRDNIGNYRQKQVQNGILNLTNDSHESIVRKLAGQHEYITRFGTEGGRGIDHILTPKNSLLENWILEAKIDREKGAEFFPSDHSLILCKFRRFGMNNNEGGTMKTRYDYKKVCAIKLKQSGNCGRILELDDNQFKDCQSFKDQNELFQKIRTLTGDTSNFTNNHLSDLEKRIKLTYASLWDDGLEQEAHGKNNNLVNISESQAIELSYIFQKFNQGVKEAMQTWKLAKEHNANDAAGKIRGRVRRKQGFKLFANLPTSTKLYYLKKKITAKKKLIKQKLYWLEEFDIRKRHRKEVEMDRAVFWNHIPELVDSSNISEAGQTIHGLIIAEQEERTSHIEAMEFKKYEKKINKKNKKSKKLKKPLPSKEDEHLKHGNMLNTSEKTTKKINFWLGRSSCKHGFNLHQTPRTFDLLISNQLSDWSSKLSDSMNLELKVDSETDFQMIKDILLETKSKLEKIYSSITTMQILYKKDILNYFLSSNKISEFTRKVLPKSRSAPSTHSIIWDSAKGDFRSCVDEVEEMIATSEFHGKWMGNSSAEEVCAYAKLIKRGRLGCRGVKLSPNRKVSKKDLDSLLPNHRKLSKKIKTAFLKAHGSHTAALFREPLEDRKELFYPFFLTSRDGNMNGDKKFITNFWKGLARIPGKARHEGFQMAVVGRLGSRWGQLLLDIAKLILLMRYIPPELRKMARFPIPKPGKANEYRPISLCNDLYCYINSISTAYTSIGIEKAELLHDGMNAYRKGRGCSSLVTTELSFREDCNEHNLPTLQLDEDEEKFFDRVPVEILLAAMRTNGFPNQGFLELKASSMQAKTVEIITAKGVAYAKFVCGLEQGNPDSPTVSNLVIKMKHDIWLHMTAEAEKILNHSNNHNGTYEFQSVDDNDGPVNLCRIGYCDDNTKFCCVKDEKDLNYLANYFLQLSGDLSMVTKIGRKSSKCELQFYNVSSDFVQGLNNFWSTAWSYVSDSPIQEAVPYKISMKALERRALYESINYFELAEEEQVKWNDIIHPKAHRHLGLNCTLNGDTTSSRQNTLAKIDERLKKLNITNMESSVQRKCVNMLCSTMHSFVPLQVGFQAKDLEETDNIISESILRKNGLTNSDCRHRLFLSENHGGLGFISLLDQDIISVSREMEIISNLPSLDGKSFRTRIQATHGYDDMEKEDIVNHAKDSIEKLSRYGIFVRDKQDDLINNILGILNESNKFPSIGTENYKDGNKYSIGFGKMRNEQLALGGPIHKIIRKWKDNDWNLNDTLKLEMQSCKIKVPQLVKIKNEALKDRFLSIAGIFSFWEWRNNNDFSIKNISKGRKKWKFVNVPNILKTKFPQNYLLLTEDQLKTEASKIVEITGWNKNTTNDSLLFNNYEYHQNLIKLLVAKKVPLIISTDGAYSHPDISRNANSNSTTSAFVISLCDIRNGESLQSGQWLFRPTIPLLSRATALPSLIGTTESDIATGELFGIALSELSIPQDLPRIIITDSKSTRDLLLGLRNTGILETDRQYTRKIVGGTSKFLFSLFQHKFLNLGTSCSLSSPSIIRGCFKESMELLNGIAQSWTMKNPTNENDNREFIWNPDYWDNHNMRSIWKIDSHQLNSDGTQINGTRRYANLIPNLGILSTNHHADVSAEYVSNFNQQLRNIKVAHSTLRFSLTWDGKTIDRHISPFIKNKIECERVKRLRSKPTQGLIWRVEQHTTNIWETFHLHKGIFRSMLGLSRSHTRCLYKNDLYRATCKEVKLTQEKNPENILKLQNSTKSQAIIDLLSPCMWCKSDDGQGVADKGNRKHMFLYCTNNKLVEFRKDMNMLLNQHLRSFCLHIAETTSWEFVDITLKEVSKKFLHHQEKHTGRLKKVSSSRNTSYLALSELCLKWEGEILIDLIKDTRCQILLDIFGITPAHNPLSQGDEELGVIDLPWLGFTPTFLDGLISNACMKLDGTIRPAATMKIISKQLCERWEEIQALILGRAIGLHRVIGATGKTLEKDFEKILLIGDDTAPENPETNQDRGSIIIDPCDQRDLNVIGKRSSSPTEGEVLLSSKKAKIDKDNVKGTQDNASNDHASFCSNNLPSKNTQDLKECQGVTCGSENIFWCQDSILDRNRIKKGTKQCQRCGRFMTAMKHANSCLLQITKDSDQNICNNIVAFCISHPNNLQFQYASFMNLLDTYLGGIQHPQKAKNINKKKPERLKLICRIIHRTIIHLTKQHDASKDVILSSANFLQKAISKLNQKHINQKEAKKIIIPSSPLFEVKCYTTEQDNSLIKSFSSNHAISANSPNIYLSGGAISYAVAVLRARLTWNIFIAHADAYISINNWTSNQSWASFGRIFTSQRVLDQKPNGIYLIPFFSGKENSGHWHLIVIEKRRHFCEGWHIDSLGKSSEDKTLEDKLQQAFLPGRGTFVWHYPQSTIQKECECGPRTIVAMDRIDKNIAMGHTIANAISEASLEHISEEGYDSKSVRMEAALLLESHVSVSIPRLRRSSPNDPQQPTQKKRRIRGKIRAIATAIDLT